jgi:hypothetical protein
MSDLPHAPDCDAARHGNAPVHRRVKLSATFLLLCLSVGYLLQLPTPLRLNSDARRYIAVAASLADGMGLRYLGQPSPFPPVEPIVLAALMKAGMCRSIVIVAINLALLATGLWITFAIIRHIEPQRPWIAWLTTVWFLSFWAVVKHSTLPGSELLYLVLSTASLLLTIRASRIGHGPGRCKWLALAALLALAATETRTIGIALAPALIVAALPARTQRMSLRTGLVFAAGALVVLALATALALSTRYVREMFERYAALGGGRVVRALALWRLGEFGEMVFNVPITRAPASAAWLFYVAGGAAMLLYLVALIHHLRRASQQGRPLALGIYLLGYTTIMAVWPYSLDVRFWIPVAPFVVALVIGFLADRAPQLGRWPWVLAPAGYWCLFLLLGLAALGYSARLSWSGREFANRYGMEEMRDVYRAAFLDKPPSTPLHGEEQHALEMLQRFEPLASERENINR